jgi:hypothetical protein
MYFIDICFCNIALSVLAKILSNVLESVYANGRKIGCKNNRRSSKTYLAYAKKTDLETINDVIKLNVVLVNCAIFT